MASEAQIRANRLNAQKSTGPRSKRGKDTVSQNAVKHGLCANKNVIRSESIEEYNIFKENMIADLSPFGAMELVMADRIVSLSWRLKRAEHFQNAVTEALIENDLFSYLGGWDRSLIYEAENQMKAGDASFILGIAVSRDFAKSRTLDLLLSYERRIESSLYNAAAEFRKMQKRRKDKQQEYRIQDTACAKGEYRRKSDTAVNSGESHPHPDKGNQDEDATLLEEYGTQDSEGGKTEDRMDSGSPVEETEHTGEESEDITEEVESVEQSQSGTGYGTQLVPKVNTGESSKCETKPI